MSVHSDMETENKAKLKKLAYPGYREQYRVYRKLSRVVEAAGQLLTEAQEGYVADAICRTVAESYDIGAVKDVYQIFGGYANDTYGLYTEKDGERQTWIFRLYKSIKDLKEVKFEHSLLRHARDNGFAWGSIPIDTRDGKTYGQIELKWEGADASRYCAVYDYIDGTEPYDWINNWASAPDCAYVKAAEILAEFHSAVRDFDPQGLNRQEPPINEIMEQFPDMLAGYQATVKGEERAGNYTAYIDSKTDYIKSVCQKARIPQADWEKLPVNATQCDFHPGNLKFDGEGVACGIFDFDWAKVDIRLFEIGLGLVYSFVSWDSDDDGAIDLGRSKKFVGAYNRRLREQGGLPPLTELEKQYLYESLLMANVYLFLWCTRLFSREIDYSEYEYLYYLQHQIRCCRWVEEHEEEIRRFAEELE